MVKRYPALDGLRAFAVGAVFFHHAYPQYFPGGFLGVDLFFVLSGFVITRQLSVSGINFKRFYLHRILRIVPPIFPVIIFAATTVILGLKLVSPTEIFLAGTSLINWARAFHGVDGGLLGHFWSLAVEEQFYLLWPLVLALFLKYRADLRVFTAGIIVIAISIQFGVYCVTGDDVRVYNGLDTRFSQLAMGCFLAFLKRFEIERFWIVPLSFFVPAVFFVKPDGDFYITWGIPLSGLMAMLLIAVAAWSQTPLNRVLEHPVVQWAGSRSYAMYLWHYPLLLVAFDLNSSHTLPAFIPVAVAFALTGIASELSQRFVERPARSLREKIDASMAPAAQVL